MRFMIIRKADADTEAGTLPSTELLAAMGQYMEEMGNAGILRGGDGLKPSSQSARVSFSRGKPSVIDGPFAESKELIAGYTIIDVPSMKDAIAWARKWPALDAAGNVQLEIRPFFEAEDFGEEFTPELREREDALRARIEGAQ